MPDGLQNHVTARNYTLMKLTYISSLLASRAPLSPPPEVQRGRFFKFLKRRMWAIEETIEYHLDHKGHGWWVQTDSDLDDALKAHCDSGYSVPDDTEASKTISKVT